MNYRHINKPHVQRVHVKKQSIVVNKPKPIKTIIYYKPISKHSISKQIDQRNVDIKAKPKSTQIRQVNAHKPQVRFISKHVKNPRVSKITNKNQFSVSNQHNALLQQYRESVDKLRCIGNNKILVILACGPSVLEANIDKLKNIDNVDIMCINKPNMRIWPSDYWLFCDQSQFSRNRETWESYKGTIINASSVRARHNKQVLIKSLSGRGFSRDIAKGFHIGRSSTYAAMQVALWMNYPKIFILGVDMCTVDGKLWFYGVNPDVDDADRLDRFNREAEYYLYAATDVLKSTERERFTFCSSYNTYPFMKYYNRIHQKDVVDKILEESNNL